MNHVERFRAVMNFQPVERMNDDLRSDILAIIPV